MKTEQTFSMPWMLIATLIILLVPCFWEGVVYGQEVETIPSYSAYAKALKAYVDDNGLVNYRGLRADQSGLASFVNEIGNLEKDRFDTWQENDRVAFLINAYNALTLQAIIDHYPSKDTSKSSSDFSIRRIDGVWDKLTFTMMGQKVTLDHIEHKLLRKKYNEPRIHMALVCGAKSCPRLFNKPFHGDKLDKQLSDQTRNFLNDPKRFRIDRSRGRVHLSNIFNWYGSDFIETYGKGDMFRGRSDKEKAVLSFIHQYLEESDADYLAKGKYAIKYLPYDWALNKQE